MKPKITPFDDVANFRCGDCIYHGEKCKCIDHSIVHFSRSCFSCDEMTAHHPVCSKFECTPNYPALYEEWLHYGFKRWYKHYLHQWLNNNPPKHISLIKAAKCEKGREPTDDIYEVPYTDFLNCTIMKPDGIHYTNYRHIERSAKSPTGYKWVSEGPGILTYDERGTESGNHQQV